MGVTKGSMRILWLTVNRSHRIAHHFDDFRRTVSELSKVEVVTLMKSLAGDHGQNMWQLSRNLISGKLVPDNIVMDYLVSDNDFDFIFCDAFFAYLNEDWTHFNIPSSIFIEDVHQEVPKHQIEKAYELGIKTIFHRFNFAFHKYHPEARFKFNCIWLPHSVRMDRYVDHLSKSIDVLHVGVHPQEFYPYRYSVVEQLRDKSYFTLIERPKDTPGVPRDGKWPIDRDYDNLLQKSKITITGGSIFDAPVQKYVEIPAANSLLMSNWFPDLGLMGFLPDTNMVTYHRETVVETVEDLLKDEEKIKRISSNGHNLILMRHTSEIRAKQFINFVCNIIGRDTYYNVEPCSFQVCFKSREQIRKDKQQELPRKQRVVRRVAGTDWRSRIKQAKL